MADILKNVRFFAGAADMTGQANKVEISPEAEEKDVTTFGSYDPATDRVWKQVVAGLKSSKGNASGFWQAGDPGLVDDAAWAALGGMSAWTICPRGAAVGDPAYVTRALQGSYQLLGAPGDIAPWSAAWSSSYPVGRGVVLHPPGTARTATGNGAAVQLPALPAGGELVATLHVLSIAGTATPSVTVTIQSDDAAGMATPTDRLTFTAATVAGGQTLRLAGPITDTYYRATWTVSGTTPSFLFVVALGLA